ncbi:MAG: hypothetical protein JWM11_8110 [Planctomycetaceae bacterium]|nr:hypothetical protein [Planctomycetaceae bacterium]
MNFEPPDPRLTESLKDRASEPIFAIQRESNVLIP